MLLSFEGAFGTDVRPAMVPLEGRKAWAKDATVGNNDGTRLDSTFINNVKGLLEGLCDAYGIPMDEGDDTALAQAVAAAIDALAVADIDGLVAALALKAPLADPTFTGDVVVPNQTLGNNTTKAANTAFVAAAIANLINSAPGALDTLNELAAALGNDANYAATITAALALKAPLASPALTGNPTAPTQTAANNSTRIATTAYVDTADALKLSIANIIDDVLHTDSNKALSANQGKLIWDGVVSISANYVPKTDIVNDVTTGGTAKPLSAQQGVVLKGLIDALGALAAATQAQQVTGTATNLYVSPGRQHFHRAAHKVWSNLNGQGTIAAIDSYNIGSHTDNGTGDYTYTNTNNFSSSSYGWDCGTDNDAGSYVATASQFSDTAPSASAIRFQTYNNTANTTVDVRNLTMHQMGTLA